MLNSQEDTIAMILVLIFVLSRTTKKKISFVKHFLSIDLWPPQNVLIFAIRSDAAYKFTTSKLQISVIYMVKNPSLELPAE